MTAMATDPGRGEKKVEPLELFFYYVSVYAIKQITVCLSYVSTLC